MGEGALAGMPLQLAGTRKILEFMDWGNYGAMGNFINIGSIGMQPKTKNICIWMTFVVFPLLMFQFLIIFIMSLLFCPKQNNKFPNQIFLIKNIQNTKHTRENIKLNFPTKSDFPFSLIFFLCTTQLSQLRIFIGIFPTKETEYCNTASMKYSI